MRIGGLQEEVAEVRLTLDELRAEGERATEAHKCREAVWTVEHAALEGSLRSEEHKGAEAERLVERMRNTMLAEAKAREGVLEGALLELMGGGESARRLDTSAEAAGTQTDSPPHRVSQALSPFAPSPSAATCGDGDHADVAMRSAAAGPDPPETLREALSHWAGATHGGRSHTTKSAVGVAYGDTDLVVDPEETGEDYSGEQAAEERAAEAVGAALARAAAAAEQLDLRAQHEAMREQLEESADAIEELERAQTESATSLAESRSEAARWQQLAAASQQEVGDARKEASEARARAGTRLEEVRLLRAEVDTLSAALEATRREAAEAAGERAAGARTHDGDNGEGGGGEAHGMDGWRSKLKEAQLKQAHEELEHARLEADEWQQKAEAAAKAQATAEEVAAVDAAAAKAAAAEAAAEAAAMTEQLRAVDVALREAHTAAHAAQAAQQDERERREQMESAATENLEDVTRRMEETIAESAAAATAASERAVEEAVARAEEERRLALEGAAAEAEHAIAAARAEEVEAAAVAAVDTTAAHAELLATRSTWLRVMSSEVIHMEREVEAAAAAAASAAELLADAQVGAEKAQRDEREVAAAARQVVEERMLQMEVSMESAHEDLEGAKVAAAGAAEAAAAEAAEAGGRIAALERELAAARELTSHESGAADALALSEATARFETSEAEHTKRLALVEATEAVARAEAAAAREEAAAAREEAVSAREEAEAMVAEMRAEAAAAAEASAAAQAAAEAEAAAAAAAAAATLAAAEAPVEHWRDHRRAAIAQAPSAVIEEVELYEQEHAGLEPAMAHMQELNVLREEGAAREVEGLEAELADALADAAAARAETVSMAAAAVVEMEEKEAAMSERVMAAEAKASLLAAQVEELGQRAGAEESTTIATAALEAELASARAAAAAAAERLEAAERDALQKAVEMERMMAAASREARAEAEAEAEAAESKAAVAAETISALEHELAEFRASGAAEGRPNMESSRDGAGVSTHVQQAGAAPADVTPADVTLTNPMRSDTALSDLAAAQATIHQLESALERVHQLAAERREEDRQKLLLMAEWSRSASPFRPAKSEGGTPTSRSPLRIRTPALLANRTPSSDSVNSSAADEHTLVRSQSPSGSLLEVLTERSERSERSERGSAASSGPPTPQWLKQADEVCFTPSAPEHDAFFRQPIDEAGDVSGDPTSDVDRKAAALSLSPSLLHQAAASPERAPGVAPAAAAAAAAAEAEAEGANTTLLYEAILRLKERSESGTPGGHAAGGAPSTPGSTLWRRTTASLLGTGLGTPAAEASRGFESQAVSELRLEVQAGEVRLEAAHAQLTSLQEMLDAQTRAAKNTRAQLADVEAALESAQKRAHEAEETLAEVHRTRGGAAASGEPEGGSAPAVVLSLAPSPPGSPRPIATALSVSPPAVGKQPSTVAKKATAERDAALAAQARLTNELEQTEGRASRAEARAAALQAEVDSLTSQLQSWILSKKAAAEQGGAVGSPFSFVRGKR